MIKTVFRIYKVTHTFSRNEIVRLICKREASDWGRLIFSNIFEGEYDPILIEQKDLAIGAVHSDFDHEIRIGKSDAGTVLVTVVLTYMQAVEIATDNSKWTAYRNIFFDSKLAESEMELIRGL